MADTRVSATGTGGANVTLALDGNQVRTTTEVLTLPKLTPTGHDARRDTSRLSGACSNTCARTAKNRAAICRATMAPTDQFPD